MQSFLQALSLLTRLPVRAEWPADAKRGRALAKATLRSIRARGARR